MLKQWPRLDITRSNRHQLRAPVDTLKYHYIQSSMDNIAEHYNLHGFESVAEHLENINSLLADNKYLFPIAEHVEGGVRGPNPMQIESKAANEWLLSTSFPAIANTWFIYIKFYHWVNNRGKYADGVNNSMMKDKDGHTPSPLIILPSPGCAIISWSGKRSKVFI